MSPDAAPAEPERPERPGPVPWVEIPWTVLVVGGSVRSGRVLDDRAQLTLWTAKPKGRRKLVVWTAGCAMPRPPILGVDPDQPGTVYHSEQGQVHGVEEAQAAAEKAVAGVVDQVRETAGRLKWM